MNNMNNLSGGVRYPINNTAYSEKNLCEELPICASARESFKVFDKYCSRGGVGCRSKILTSSEDSFKDIVLSDEKYSELAYMLCEAGGFP